MNTIEFFKEIPNGANFMFSQPNPKSNEVKTLMKFFGENDPTGLLYQSVVQKNINALMEK